MPTDSEVLRAVEVAVARLEGKVDATLVDHGRRLADLETTSRAAREQLHERLNRKARMLADHAARIEDLEQSRDTSLPRAAQGAGILTGVGAMVMAIWARLGGG